MPQFSGYTPQAVPINPLMNIADIDKAQLINQSAMQDLTDRATLRAQASGLAAGDPMAVATASTLPSVNGPAAVSGNTAGQAGITEQQSRILASAAPIMGALAALPADQRAAAWPSVAPTLRKMGLAQTTDAYPGDVAVTMLRNAGISAKEQLEYIAARPVAGPTPGPLGLPPGQRVGPGGPTAAAAPGGAGFSNLLAGRESSGDPSQVNQLGYSGKYQFGTARLADPSLGFYQPASGESLARNEWKGTLNIPGFPGVKTHADFLHNASAQDAVFAAHVADIDAAIKNTPGADKLSQDGLRAVAHLGGVGGMQKFIASNGQYNPADANGTRLSDYYNHFAKNGAPALVSHFGDPGAAQRAGGAQPASAPVAAPGPVADGSAPQLPAPTQTPTAPTQVASAGGAPGMPVTATDAGAPAPVPTGGPAPVPAPAAPVGSTMPPDVRQRVAALAAPSLPAGPPPNALASLAVPPQAAPVPMAAATPPVATPASAPVATPAPQAGPDANGRLPDGRILLRDGKSGSFLPVPGVPGGYLTQDANGNPASPYIVPTPQKVVNTLNRNTGEVIQTNEVGGQVVGRIQPNAITVLNDPNVPASSPQYQQAYNAYVQQYSTKDAKGNTVSPDMRIFRTPTAPLPNGDGSGSSDAAPTAPGTPLGAGVQTHFTGREELTKALDADRSRIADIRTAGQSAQNRMPILNEASDLSQEIASGYGAATKAKVANFIASNFGDGALELFNKGIANLPDPAKAQLFNKLNILGAGQGAKETTGGNTGVGSLTLYQEANPGMQLLPDANVRQNNLMRVAQQANIDYSNAALAHFNPQEDSIINRNGNKYAPLAKFDEQWQQQNNPKVYATAMAILNGDPENKWPAKVTPVELARAHQVADNVNQAKSAAGSSAAPSNAKPAAQPAGAPPSTPVVLNPASAAVDYGRLPSGALYVSPDGQTRRKQ